MECKQDGFFQTRVNRLTSSKPGFDIMVGHWSVAYWQVVYYKVTATKKSWADDSKRSVLHMPNNQLKRREHHDYMIKLHTGCIFRFLLTSGYCSKQR